MVVCGCFDILKTKLRRKRSTSNYNWMKYILVCAVAKFHILGIIKSGYAIIN